MAVDLDLDLEPLLNHAGAPATKQAPQPPRRNCRGAALFSRARKWPCT